MADGPIEPGDVSGESEPAEETSDSGRGWTPEALGAENGGKEQPDTLERAESYARGVWNSTFGVPEDAEERGTGQEPVYDDWNLSRRGALGLLAAAVVGGDKLEDNDFDAYGHLDGGKAENTPVSPPDEGETSTPTAEPTATQTPAPTETPTDTPTETGTPTPTETPTHQELYTAVVAAGGSQVELDISRARSQARICTWESRRAGTSCYGATRTV